VPGTVTNAKCWLSNGPRFSNIFGTYTNQVPEHLLAFVDFEFQLEHDIPSGSQIKVVLFNGIQDIEEKNSYSGC